MRSAPIPVAAPLKSEVDTSRSSVVPRAGTSRTLTLCAPTLDAVFVPPVGKNCTKAFALWSVMPIVELLNMLRPVWKCVPFAPDAEQATGLKTSCAAASAPMTAPFGNAGVLSESVNEHGFASNCCASVLLMLVVPVRCPLLAVALLPRITSGAPPPVGISDNELKPLPSANVAMSKFSGTLLVPLLGPMLRRKAPLPAVDPPCRFAPLMRPAISCGLDGRSDPATAPLGNCDVLITKKKFPGFD